MSLLAPLYLAAFAALVLPWSLHRFNDAEPERRPFPSTRFLEAAAPPVSRRRRLRHRQLLALRVLAVVGLALLFAEPWIRRPDTMADARVLHVLAVDTSMSMRAGARADRAQDAARATLDAVSAGDLVRLVSFDRDVRLVGDEAVSAAEGRAALDRLTPGYAAADYGRLMQRLDRLADESALPVRATLFTDVQRSALPARLNTLYAPRLAALDIVDVGADEPNVALVAEATSGNGAQARVRVTLTASASGDAADPAFERDVLLSRDGETLARRSVRLVPGGRETVVFDAVTLPETAEPRFDVGFATSDALAEDDRVTVPVSVGGARRVALAALETRAPSAARVFVTTALEADGGATVDASALDAGQLPEDARRLVAFVPLAAPDALPASLLRHVARGGAALLVDAGRRAESAVGAPGIADDAVAGIGSAENRENADGPRIDGEAGEVPDPDRDGSGVGRVDDSHPLALGDIVWGDVRFYETGNYVPGEDDRVLIETADRRPLLIERPSDNGSLLVLNERLDGNDSNLPFQPAFVSLMQHVFDWFDAGGTVPSRVTVGDPLSLPLNVQVIDPDGRALLGLGDSAGAEPLVLDAPGLYTVAGPLGDQTLMVDTDPRESDLAVLGDAERDAWIARHGEGPVDAMPDATAGVMADSQDGAGGGGTDDPESPGAMDARDARDAAASTADVSRATAALGSAREQAARLPLWPYLLPLLAVLLLVETLYANRRLDVRRDGT